MGRVELHILDAHGAELHCTQREARIAVPSTASSTKPDEAKANVHVAE